MTARSRALIIRIYATLGYVQINVAYPMKVTFFRCQYGRGLQTLRAYPLPNKRRAEATRSSTVRGGLCPLRGLLKVAADFSARLHSSGRFDRAELKARTIASDPRSSIDLPVHPPDASATRRAARHKCFPDKRDIADS